MTWQSKALCAGVPWFNDPAQQQEALNLCNGEPCPVRLQCYRTAEADKAFDGVAGGQLFRTSAVTPPEWSEADMRFAHAAFQSQGDRSEWAVQGERAYQAARKRERRAARRAA